MSKNLTDMHAQVIDYLKQGKFVEGIEEFYAEDASAQENTNTPTVGQATMVKNERAFLTTVTAYHELRSWPPPSTIKGEGTGWSFTKPSCNGIKVTKVTSRLTKWS
jgi:hypothetical protein